MYCPSKKRIYVKQKGQHTEGAATKRNDASVKSERETAREKDIIMKAISNLHTAHSIYLMHSSHYLPRLLEYPGKEKRRRMNNVIATEKSMQDQERRTRFPPFFSRPSHKVKQGLLLPSSRKLRTVWRTGRKGERQKGKQGNSRGEGSAASGATAKCISILLGKPHIVSAIPVSVGAIFE